MSSCWGITDGSAGMVAQVSALAEAMQITPEMKVIALKNPYKFLPNIAYDYGLKNYVLSHALANPQILTEPYPELIISCGRKAALVTAALKHKNHSIKTIHIQDPQMSARNFDLVVAMEHDKISGDNVIKTRFALHSITTEKLEQARIKFSPLFAHYPKPHIAVLLGGSTNKYSFTAARMKSLIATLQNHLAENGGSLLITPSRRTGEENIEALKQAFYDNKNVYIYDGKNENPYLGMLSCADKIMVTNDSVNMMTEAFATGKPVTIIELEGHKNTKPANFANMIKANPQINGNEMAKLVTKIRQSW